MIRLLHSLDSGRLAVAIEDSNPFGPPVPILVEVNVSGDSSKHGVSPEQAKRLIAVLGEMHSVSVRGLMAMASSHGVGKCATASFARLRELRDRLCRNCQRGMTLDELSMGMSGDFEEVIVEGATIARIGSRLFEDILLRRSSDLTPRLRSYSDGNSRRQIMGASNDA